MVLSNKVHCTLIGNGVTILREGVEIDDRNISDYLFTQALHPIEEDLIGLSLLARHILVVYLPKSHQDRSFTYFNRVIWLFNSAPPDLFGQDFVLLSHPLPFKFFIWVTVRVLCIFCNRMLPIANESSLEDTLAEDRIEIIGVKLFNLALNCRLDILLGRRDVL